MKTALVLLAFAVLSACGVEPEGEETGAVTTASPALSQAPGTDCVTCSRGLNDPSCDLCLLCRRAAADGRALTAQAGCLPTGAWCGDTTATTCRVQTCSTCP